MAARSENIELIKKNLGKIVILIDRFVDSTVSYQHYGLGANLKLINEANKHLLKNIKVDFTFLNIVNKKNMIKRLKLRKSLNRYDRFDYGIVYPLPYNLHVNACFLKMLGWLFQDGHNLA